MSGEGASSSATLGTVTFMQTVSNDALTALTSTQKGFIISMRSIPVELTGATLRAHVSEMFPPANLFAKEICDMPSVWVQLRNFLDARGAEIQQHSSRRVIMTLAHGLYDEPEERDAAVEMAQLIQASSRRVRSDLRNPEPSPLPVNVPPAQGNSNVQGFQGRLAHDVGMRLKDADKKFSGELGECWMEFVDDYQQVAIDYNLSPPQKLQYIHNLLSKDAKRFYLERVATYAQTFQQAVDMVNQEYNSPVRQTRVKNYLNSLRVSEFVKKGDEKSAALAKVYRLITKLSRQVPASHRGDAHKIEFLRNATVGYTWSHEPLSRVATHGLSFQMLYGELEAALQLDKEAKVAIARDSASSAKYAAVDEVDIRFAGQGRYGRNPKDVRGRGGPSRGSSLSLKTKTNPLDISGCFNCDSPNHLIGQCPHPKNAAKAAARRLEYYKKKDEKRHAVHLVLADICRQLDLDDGVAEEDGDGGDDNGDDVELFLAAMSGRDNYDPSQMPSASDEDELEEVTLHVLTTNWESPSSRSFEGACVDSGAQKTVIGVNQAKEYCALVNEDLNNLGETKKVVYTFGSHRHKGVGRINIRIPISTSFFLSFTADVVDVDVPLLLGLDVLTASQLILDFAEDEVCSKADGWKFPLTRKNGHVYLEWTVGVFYTSTELRKIHRHFYHPHPGKLYSVMKRADRGKVSPDLMSDLERISATCDVCQREADAPHRFRVALPDADCVFNRTVCLDLMSLQGMSVLHAVDKDTKFSAACFLERENTEEIWESFMRIWVSPYIGYPDEVSTDQGPQFRATEWKNLLQAAGIKENSSGVESHNALGVGERYHAYLRRVYNKVRAENPTLTTNNALQLAVKATNDTAGPSGLVPTLLVFGVLPRLPLLPKDLPDNLERLKAMHGARKEMAKISNHSKLVTATSSNVPAAADRDFLVGDEVLMFREKPVGKWVGPYHVCDRDEKMLTLDSGDRMIRASVDKVKPYLEYQRDLETYGEPLTSDPADLMAGAPAVVPENDFLNDAIDDEHLPDPISHQRESLSTGTDALEEVIQGIRDAEDAHDDSPSNTWFVSFSPTNDTFAGVLFTEVLKPEDPRGSSPSFQAAKSSEIEGLKARGVWKIVQKCDVPAGANVLGGRFVLALKNCGTLEEKPKARYIAQGHRDKDKPYMVHDTATLRSSSVRLLLSIAAVKGFRVFSHDVNQAYVQSKDKLTRQVFIMPRKEDRDLLGITDDEILELILPLYGICDAGDYWGVTVEYHVQDDLDMTPCIGDAAMYVKLVDGVLQGIMGVYVDDNLNAGTTEFEEMTRESLEKFDSKPRVYDDFAFFGSDVSTSAPGSFLLSQSRYAKRLSFIEKGCTYVQFRRHRAMLSWLCNTRPDLCCIINRAAQVTADTMCSEKVSEFNKAIKLAKDPAVNGLQFLPLNHTSLVLKVYADAAFSCNDDLSSQIAYIIILCDGEGHAHILDYSSKKSKRVVRSIMGGEVYAFADAFDKAFVIRKDMENTLGVKLPLHMFTDSKQLFDAMTKGQQTTEKRLMIDISAAREAYRKFDISRVGLVSTLHNPADGLSKIKDNGALRDLIITGRDSCPVQQWIVRDETSSVK